MKQRLRQILQLDAFFITSFAFIFAGAIVLMLYDKIAIHIAVNSVHNEFLDFFFKYWTHLGDGIVLPILVLLFGIISFRKLRFAPFISGWGALILGGFLAQLLKRYMFEGALRPSTFIKNTDLYYVPGVEVYTTSSFPSGHTTAAFAFFGFVALTYFRKNRIIQMFLAIAAVLVGYSRMYLSQHFLEDVIAGGCLGIFCFVVVGLLTDRKETASS